MARAEPDSPARPRGRFVDGRPMRHVAVMTGTAAIGLMALFLVDLADMYFLSLLGEVELAAAIGYAGSVLFFTTSICIGLAIAMAALVARAVGAGDLERARRYVVTVSLYAIATTVPFAALVWLAVPWLLQGLGADGRALELATGYLRIIVPSMPVLALAMAAGGVLRAVGDARRAMLSTVAGGGINALLDPLLIFTAGLGVDGAALASVAARITVLVVGAHAVIRRQDMLGRCTRHELAADFGPIAAIAGPAMLTNVATPVGNAFVTATIAGFGDAAVAGLSIIGRVLPVAFGVVFALSGAVGPIIGQNAGAGRLDRVRRTLLDALLFAAAVVAVVSLILWLIRDGLVAAFSVSGDAAALIRFYCTVIAWTFVFNAALFVANAAFNNLGRPFWSTLTNWLKATVGTIPLVWLGASLGGPEGALLGQAGGAVLTGTLACWLAFRLTGRAVAPMAPAEASGLPGYALRVPLAAFATVRGWVGLGTRE